MKKTLLLTVLSILVLTTMIATVACGTKTPETAPAPTPSTTPPTQTQPTPETKTALGPNEVEISADGFSPATLTVPVGTKVIWINRSDRRWWVTSESKIPDTGVIPITIRMGYTFDKAGVYEYYDLYHNEYKGKIIVK
jgi:plastocyanin